MAGGGHAASNWWDWAMGLLVVVWDALSQRIASVTLPPRLPVTPLPHLTCVLTSCAPGVALETAKHLAESGARVVFAVADTDAARELVASWAGDHVDDDAPPLNCEVMEMDFLSLDSVRKFAVNWEARGLPLNVLINIGSTSCINGPQERVSKDGFEQHMQVNHLAPALLTLLLLPSLLRGSPSRVVMVNSVVHHLGHLDSDDLNLSGNGKTHKKLTSYANSKLAQLLFSNLLQRRLPREAGVDIICVHPGQVTTEAATGARGILQKLPLYLLSPVEGARSVLFCAADEQVQDYARALRGLSYPLAPYFGSDCKPCSVARQAHDTDKAHLVWHETLSLVRMPVECVEVAVSESDPSEVDFNDIKYMESFPAASNGEDFEFLLENGDDVDDFFHGADDN